ncbi:phage tail assembly protein [uncultured Anaeromusa sp.]|uniref:phage tail assembly protein n=1 Tax=uncultured Anaeromusa sp. TaxID=673273 RepID=UPI0029C7931A|nr:phage tail assembly protein [uncultured Anaeromusa sp.]
MLIKFTKPVTINGKETKEITLKDPDTLRGRDLLDAENEARQLGDRSPTIQFSNTYAAVIAAKLAGAPIDDVLDIPGPDFMKLTVTVQNVLLGKAL